MSGANVPNTAITRCPSDIRVGTTETGQVVI